MLVLIAAAWPYASGPRHLGHLAGVYVPADVAARWHRLRGDDVLFVSGSDQYGTPITIAAEHTGEPVADFAGRQHAAIAATFARAGISFDHYGETAVAEHAAVVHWLFHALRRGDLFDEVRTPSAWCPTHGRALPDRYVEGGCPRCGADGARGDQCDTCGSLLDAVELLEPRCRRCASPTELRLQRQLRLRLDRLQRDVEAYVEAGLTTRPFAHEETRAVLRAGLQPRAVTRDLEWGVTVPLTGWDDRRLYVWFDAVIGYLSASKVARPNDWQSWWCNAPGQRHRYFVGKDNVWFHTIWWPAILLGSGAGLRVPDEVVASHHLLQRGEQLSTSRAHGDTADTALDRVGADALRHALIALAPETSDTDFTWELADAITRTGLLGSIANPAHRVATLIWQRFPECGFTIEPDPRAIRALADVGNAIDRGEFRAALAAVHDIGRHINQQLAATEPWHLPDADAQRVLGELVPLVDALATAAWPFVPTTAERIRTAFGWPAVPVAWSPERRPAAVTRRPEPPFRHP